MHAHAEPPPPPESVLPRSPFEHAELRSILPLLTHQLCLPLVSLREGFDGLLNDASRRLTDDQRGHLRSMIAVCDDVLRLTRGYLDYAAIAQDTRPLDYGSHALADLIREIDRRFAPEAAARGLDWHCRIDDADAVVATDKTRCQQVLGSLLTNALAYTPAGGRVALSARLEGPRWYAHVADTGPGIPASDQARVFEPFFRLPREERSKVEGHGLGLAICRELVDRLGGDMTLQSRPGEGTSVTVRLPVEAPTERD